MQLGQWSGSFSYWFPTPKFRIIPPEVLKYSSSYWKNVVRLGDLLQVIHLPYFVDWLRRSPNVRGLSCHCGNKCDRAQEAKHCEWQIPSNPTLTVDFNRVRISLTLTLTLPMKHGSTYGIGSVGLYKEYQRARVSSTPINNPILTMQVEELFDNIPKGEATRVRNGKLACLVCPNKPVMDTLQMLAVHRSSKKHQYDSKSVNSEPNIPKNLIPICILDQLFTSFGKRWNEFERWTNYYFWWEI